MICRIGCCALVAFAAFVGWGRTQTLVEGDSLADAIAAAKTDYESTSDAQEIVLGAGTYVLAAKQTIQLPLVIRGATGNPADVTIDGQKKIQLFQLDHADAAILGVTLKGGYVCPGGDYVPYFGGAVLIEKIHADSGSGQQSWQRFYTGAGGMVSNCVITGCASSMGSGNSGAHGAAIVCFSPGGVVTHCVITNNTSSRWANTSGDDGTIVNMSRGTIRNCVIAKNSQVKWGSEKRSDNHGCIVSVGNPAKMIGCTVAGNSADGENAATVLTVSGAKVVNTVIAGNATTSTLTDYATWRGTAASFVNCVSDSDAAINETCQTATLAEVGFLDASGGDYRPLAGSPLLGAGTTDAAYDYGVTDIYGKPRFRDETIDVGAAQYEAGAYVLACTFTADTRLYAPRTPTYAVTKACGFGEAPVCYWDFDGDGVTDLVTTETTVTPTFGAGTYATTLCVSNAAATFGAKYVFDDPFVVTAQPVRYVKAGNAGAAEPYLTEATAAADIQTAIDYCGVDERVVVLKGTYNTTSAVTVNKRIEVVGATGNPEDVIIHNTANGYRCLYVTSAGAGALVASMTLENGKPDWDHDHTTSYSGTGALLAAGTVSNLVVRGCTSKIDSLGIGAAIQASGSSTFVTHCVITNNIGYGGNRNQFYLHGIGLHLTDGARAENCLIADNCSGRNSYDSSGWWYGWGHCAAFVGTGSRMRFCTVVGNSTVLAGGVATYGTGVFEECLVAGNTVSDSTLDNKARHAIWSAFDPSVTYSKASIATEENQTAEAASATDIAANQVYAAVDNESHGLGATTVCTTTAKLIRDKAKKNWRLAKKSPAINAIPKSAVTDAPATDLYGRSRPFGPCCDIGCEESAYARGAAIFLR